MATKPKLDIAWTPYTDDERQRIRDAIQRSAKAGEVEIPVSLDELVGRYEAALAQYEPPDTIDVDIVEKMRREDPDVAFDVLKRWNLALHASRIRLTAEAERLGKQILGLETRIRCILDGMISVPDGTFLRDLAGELRGWARDETGPTSGYAEEIAQHLEDLAIILSKEPK